MKLYLRLHLQLMRERGLLGTIPCPVFDAVTDRPDVDTSRVRPAAVSLSASPDTARTSRQSRSAQTTGVQGLGNDNRRDTPSGALSSREARTARQCRVVTARLYSAVKALITVGPAAATQRNQVPLVQPQHHFA